MEHKIEVPLPRKDSEGEIDMGPESSHEPLSAERASNLLFLSFKFSQGRTEIQKLLFQWLKANHPEWRIDDQLAEKVSKLATVMAEKVIKPIDDFADVADATQPGRYHGGMRADAVEDAIKDQLGEMGSVFENKEPLEKDRLISDLTEKIVSRDLELVSRPKGRPRRWTSLEQRRPATDPFLSHFCYYALEGHRTGDTLYDELFREIREHAKKRKGGRFTPEMQSLIELYT